MLIIISERDFVKHSHTALMERVKKNLIPYSKFDSLDFNF